MKIMSFKFILFELFLLAATGCTATTISISLPEGTSEAGLSALGSASGSFDLISASPGTGSVTLTWNSSTDARSYTLAYGTSSGSYSTVYSTSATSPMTVSGLANGTKYYFMVTAVTGTGSIPATAEATATPIAQPGAFTISSAASGNGQVTVTWGASAGAASYMLRYGTSSGSYATTFSASATSPTIVNGLTNGTQYYFMVTAVNGSGATNATAEATATPIASPAAFTITSAVSFDSKVTLTWGASAGASTYTIKYGTSTGSYPTTFSSAATSPTSVTGLTNGTQYYFMVVAVNGSGSTQATAEAIATPDTLSLQILGPSVVYPGVCSTYQVGLQNSQGFTTRPSQVDFQLASASQGTFYGTTSNCSSSITQLSFPADTGFKKFYFKFASGQTPATLSLTDLLVNFVTSAFNVTVGTAGNSGALDTSFGTAGKGDTVYVRSAQSSANGVAFQSDGKIILGGYAANGSDESIALARYNTDGTLDTSFGTNGIALKRVNGGTQMFKFKVQSDDKIVALGYVPNLSYLPVVVRFNANGSLDTSFGTSGVATVQINAGNDLPYDLAIQANGKIVVVLSTYLVTTKLAVVRLNTDGSFDGTFGTAGKVSPNLGAEVGFYRVVIQPSDQKIVVTGALNIVGGGYFVARFETDGDLDPTFNGTGFFTSTLLHSVYAIALQPSDEKIVLGGTDAAGNPYFVLARYNTNGSLDTSFGTSGFAAHTLGGVSPPAPRSIVIQSTGEIALVVGGLNNLMITLRLTSTGAFDPTFNSNGVRQTSFGGIADATGLAIDTNGKLVVSGYSGSTIGEFTALRFNTNGTFDTGFNSTGKVVTSVGIGSLENTSLAVQPNGKILVSAVNTKSGSDPITQFLVYRYNRNGTLDTAFGTSGQIRPQYNALGDQARSVVVQPDGKIVVGGNEQVTASKLGYLFARFKSDGTPDTTFGTGGLARQAASALSKNIYTVALQPDGKVLGAGSLSSGGVKELLVRYTTTGSLDTSFGTAGEATTDVFDGPNPVGIIVQADGKILTAGYDTSGGSPYAYIVRHNANGSLDTNFADSGIAYVYGSSPVGVVVQTDGKIVFIGGTDGGVDTTLLRFETDGSQDNSFGSFGEVVTHFAGYTSSRPTSIALQPDGKLLASVDLYDGTVHRAAFVKYTSAGNLDTSFNLTGIATTSLTTTNAGKSRMALEPDGTLIMIGGTLDTEIRAPAVTQFWP